MILASSVGKIKNVGEKTTEKLAKAGIFTISDLINYLPKRHESFEGVVRISDIKAGKVVIFARCRAVSTRIVRRGMKVTTAVFEDKSGSVKAVWFNQAYREKQLKNSKEEFFISGNYEFRYNKYQITSPSIEKQNVVAGSDYDILPVYRAIKGLKSDNLLKMVHEVRPLMRVVSERLPSEILDAENLLDYGRATELMHFPKDKEQLEKAKNRFAFEELFWLMLASECNKYNHSKLKSFKIDDNLEKIIELIKTLPYTLTNAQKKVLWQIIQDLQGENPMNRLVQGDVGSGKTVTAGVAAYMAVLSGYQVAFMAPTEILARQHAKNLANLLGGLGVNIGFLVGSVKGLARKNLLENIKNGNVDILVGTHALIQDSVEYKNLGFVVIDEQHRFGVNQRKKLLQNSQKMPHLLALTATPIPRSLALTLYGELDISVIDELPSNRLPIKTKLVSPVSRDEIYKKIDQEINQGRQVYFVCGLIEEGESELKNVTAEYKKLKNSVFGHRRLAVLHGKMKPDEKSVIMKRLVDKEIDILVSTTVIEVGVDVPNASIMVIENPERFGLSQLHQLRGRVGRGEYQSYCYLMLSDTKKPSRRLLEVEKSNDGFYLSEVDMELRGAGEIYGKAQSGALNLQVAKFSDTLMIEKAQKHAKIWAEKYDTENITEKYPYLAQKIEEYQKITTLN